MGKVRKIRTSLAGYTRRSKLVNFKAPKTAIGKIVKVKITDAKSWSLDGEMVGEGQIGTEFQEAVEVK